jgi:molybdopterin/thiamine biosynthesis adenylyltransferase
MFKCHKNLSFWNQELLNNKSVLVIGLGGLGSHASMQLACMGIKNIGLCDFDSVELSNISRQYYFENQVNSRKVDALAYNISLKIAGVVIHKFYKFDDSLVTNFDVILDCTDNVKARIQIYDSCKYYSKFHIFGSSIGFEGQLLVNKCIYCAFPNLEMSNTTCNITGVLSSVPGIIGTMQAIEAVKYLTNNENIDKLLHFDFLSGSFNSLKLPECNCTSKPRTNNENFITIDLRSYEEYSQTNDENSIFCSYGSIGDVVNIIKNRKSGNKYKLLCDSGNISELYKKRLIKLGYSKNII